MPRRYWKTLIGVAVTAVYLFPIYWMVSTSLKTRDSVFSVPPAPFPDPVDPSAYGNAVLGDSVVLRSLGNSAIISFGTLALTLIVGIPAAYGLARLRLRFTIVASLVFLIAQMLPAINVALPLFVLFSQGGLVDTYAGLILANTAFSLSFTIIVLRPYFYSVPETVVDAARVDGCSRWTAFLRVVIPLAMPGIVTAAALTFVSTWGEFIFGLTLTTSESMQPITVTLNQFIGQENARWNDLMAVATAAAAPVIILFVVLQRFIVSGLTSGATKE